MPDATTDQLRAASTTLRRRFDRAEHPELGRSAVDHLCRVLDDAADGRAPAELHAEAVALAHRIVDDDRPQDSSLWRSAADR